MSDDLCREAAEGSGEHTQGPPENCQLLDSPLPRIVTEALVLWGSRGPGWQTPSHTEVLASGQAGVCLKLCHLPQ